MGISLPLSIGHHPLKSSNDLPRLSVERPQCRNDFESFCDRFAREDYLNGRLSIVLDVTPNRDVNAVSNVSVGRYQVVENRPLFVLQFHAVDSDKVNNRDQENMFVVDVESVNGANIAVPSLVRFHALNHQVEDGRSSAYFSCLCEIAYKFLPRIGNGKLSPSSEGSGAELFNYTAPSEIESASQIVDCISGDKCNFPFECSVSQCVVKELLPRLAINLEAGWLSIRRSADAFLKVRDVLLGPFDL